GSEPNLLLQLNHAPSHATSQNVNASVGDIVGGAVVSSQQTEPNTGSQQHVLIGSNHDSRNNPIPMVDSSASSNVQHIASSSQQNRPIEALNFNNHSKTCVCNVCNFMKKFQEIINKCRKNSGVSLR